MKKKYLAAAMASLAGACVLTACGGGDSDSDPVAPDPFANAPTSIRTTWFGISNWHYQIGESGVILDGEVVNSGRTPNPAAVSKALSALTKKGTVDMFLVGHEHSDHAAQIPEYAKQTGKHVYAPAAVCAAVVAYGNPASQCTTLDGAEVIKVNEFTDIRVVRWLHSLDCGEVGNGTAGVDTFGFLITARTRDKTLSIYASDSGAGGVDLFIPRVKNKGMPNEKVYGSPFTNLQDAVNQAGIDHIDLWQGGPESRVVNQARVLMPAFGIKFFQPHHLGTRATTVDGVRVGFSMEYGLHFPYLPSEVPKLTDFMKSTGTTPYNPANYFDAWVLDKSGFRVDANTEAKAVYGLPATGPGPGKQGPNPRSGQLECTGD